MRRKTILRKQEKTNRGITLIALVITIIVLLILAGVSIATLTGENGILKKASTSKIETEKATAKEKVQMAVMGSFDNTGKLDYTELKTNLDNVEGIDKNTVPNPITELPITVVVDGYSFIIDEKGRVELAGPRPIIDESSIKITLKEGENIPTEGVDEGTELKITFTASIEDGSITNATPGTVQNGQITYITTGTEKEVTFKIIGKVGIDTYETTYTVSLIGYYKKTEFKTEDIKNAPSTFYGAEVTGYDCPSDGVSKWRIFYADSSNIYLIADDYIDYTKAPDGQAGTKISKNGTNYKLSFNNVYKDYEGSAWILGTHTDASGNVVDNSLAKKWLNQYFNYTSNSGTYPNKTSKENNIRAVAYLLDTSVWNVYAGGLAVYAVGGPPLELYWRSYNQTHPGGDHPYPPKANGYAPPAFAKCRVTADFEEIYLKAGEDNSLEYWVPSPTWDPYSTGNLFAVSYSNGVYGRPYTHSKPGIRPFVCLKSGVQLRKTGDRVYAIQEGVED